VVPWNESDAQIAGAAVILREGLRTSLPAKIAQGRLASRSAVRGIPAMEELETTLRPLIQAVGSSYLKNVQVFPPQGPGTDRPRLWSRGQGEGPTDQEGM
jgi:FxsC-like protein